VKILLTGGNGQVGWELRRTLAPLGDLVAVDRRQMDLRKPQQISTLVREVKPDIIINAAAYTAVDAAEEESETAMAINGTAPGIFAEECRRLGSLLIHYSTDYVFDGRKSSPYIEDDDPCPVNVYGHSKLLGETRIREVGPAHLIFRTSWIYGTRGKNFFVTMRRLAGERPELQIVDDQIGSPTWSRMVAEATAQIIAKGIAGQEVDREWFGNRTGMYHMTAAGTASWHAFAKAIFEQLGLPVRLAPIDSSAYPTAAQRPTNSCLDNGKLGSTFGMRIPDWRNGLALCVEDDERRANSCK